MVKQDEAMRTALEMANIWCETPFVARLRKQVRAIVESTKFPVEVPQIPAVREHFEQKAKDVPAKNARQSRLGQKGGIRSGVVRSGKAEKEYRKEALCIAKMLCAVEPGSIYQTWTDLLRSASHFPPIKRKRLSWSP